MIRLMCACAFGAALVATPGAAFAQSAEGFRVATTAQTQIVELQLGQVLPRAKLLTPGTQRYLRYFVKDGHRNPLDIWTRVISFEIKDGRRLLRIRQQWDGAGPRPTTRIEDSLMTPDTMVPVFHLRSKTTPEGVTVDAFRFDGKFVTGDPDVADNASRDFRIEAADAPYNFVVDIEWFRQLPMATGRIFSASLFDPPSGQPAVYSFTVVGSDQIVGPDGRQIACWLVTTDYNQPDRPLARYWFAKSNQFMIRQESDAGARGTLVKTLIANEAADDTR